MVAFCAEATHRIWDSKFGSWWEAVAITERGTDRSGLMFHDLRAMEVLAVETQL